MGKHKLKLLVLTRHVHKSFTPVSPGSAEIFFDYLTQGTANSFGAFKNAARTANSEEKRDPLNCLASLCYKQEHEQLLQIIRFLGVDACQDKRCSSSSSAIT